MVPGPLEGTRAYTLLVRSYTINHWTIANAICQVIGSGHQVTAQSAVLGGEVYIGTT